MLCARWTYTDLQSDTALSTDDLIYVMLCTSSFRIGGVLDRVPDRVLGRWTVEKLSGRGANVLARQELHTARFVN